MKDEIMETGISQQVYDLIYSEAEALREFEKQEEENKLLSAQKRAAASVEKKESSAQISNLQEEINNLKQELGSEIEELQRQIMSKETEYKNLTGRGSFLNELNNLKTNLEEKKIALVKLEKKKISLKYSEEKKQEDIKSKNNEIMELENNIQIKESDETNRNQLNQIEEISKEIADLKQQLLAIQSPIIEKEKYLTELTRVKNKKGGTLSNKKKQIHKLTKRGNNNKTKLKKLTKKLKKIKIPKKTRKNM